MNSQIVYLDVRSLVAHPDNPRKDLGDLTELAESIRVKGVMQNLTVVPMQEGMCPSCSSYLPSSPRLCSRDDTKNERVPCSKWESAGKYTIVIGHRRAAAAKKAGVETVPCVISEMDPREQLETMLLENIQRSDLTVIEQARGFQMMLDFGASIDDIAQRTGFSSSTVRRRVKLMELDQKHLESAVARGGSLMDYMELDQIADPALRDEVLRAIGTDNFKNALMSAKRREENRLHMLAWEAVISTFAKKIMKRDFVGDVSVPMDYVRSYAEWNTKTDTVEIPADVGTVKYYYTVEREQIYLYSEHVNRIDPAAEARKIADDEFRKMKAQLSGIADGHYQLRMDFVRDYSGAKKHMPEISRLVGRAIVGDGKYRGSVPVSPFAMEHMFGLKIEDDVQYPSLYAMLEPFFVEKPEHTMLALAYAVLDQGGGYFRNIWNKDLGRFQFVHDQDAQLDMVYAFLGELGYEMSDEEHEMLIGTHPLLEKFIEPERTSTPESDDDDDDFDDDDDEDEEDA